VLYVLVLWKQPSFKQPSVTVSAKCRITQIIAQWVPGSWAGNSKCPTPIRAETVLRHNEIMTTGRTKMSSTGHITVTGLILASLKVLLVDYMIWDHWKQEAQLSLRDHTSRDLRSFVIQFDFESYVRFEIRFVLMVRFEIYESSTLSIFIRKETVGGG